MGEVRLRWREEEGEPQRTSGIRVLAALIAEDIRRGDASLIRREVAIRPVAAGPRGPYRPRQILRCQLRM